MRKGTKGLLAGGAAVVLISGAVAAPKVIKEINVSQSGGESSLAAFHADHGNFNPRGATVATYREKVESGAEASNSPNAEAYASQAYPKTYIAPAQVKNGLAAFDNARSRAGSAALTGTTGNWHLAGPTSGAVPGPVTYTGTDSNVSGRVTALAITPRCRQEACSLYVGTAGGGVWVSRNPLAASPTWRSIGSDIPSGAIGSLALDPNDPTGRTIYVGTGEQNGSSDSEAGVGMYKSVDGGQHFTEVAGFTADSAGRAIGSIAVDPHNPNHILAGTDVARHGASSVNGGRFTPPNAPTLGLYETTDGGTTWTLVESQPGDPVLPTTSNGGDFFAGGVSQIQFDPIDGKTVYAAINAYGLFRRDANAVNPTDWSEIYATPYGDSISSRISFSVVGNQGSSRMYLGDATMYYDGTSLVSGLVRTDDARAAVPTWITLSDPTPGMPGYGSYNWCHTQCSYDMNVATNPLNPDLVMLSGSMNYNEIFTRTPPSNGRAVVRSTDAGRDFTDMTNDAASSPNGLHPDQHALVFVPGTTDEWFSASDGGVVRQSGPFVDASAQCANRGLTGTDVTDCQAWLSAIPTTNQAINTGLDTLQLQSVSVSPNGQNLLGGTQDNGTWSFGPSTAGFESVGGDGGQSGFNVKNPNIRYHSYYAPQHDVNFNGSDPMGWDWISDPLMNSGEAASFYTPLTADPIKGGTVFDGLQHVWRTTDNGGDQAALNQHCNELTGDFPLGYTCGDWVPVGPDLSGANAGNYVVAIARGLDNGTMWAGTRRGSLWVSKNVNAASASAVSFVQVNDPRLPSRFISSIIVDPANPNHAWLSYSGYSAYRAGGHVFEVWYSPITKTLSNVKDLSYDLGDQPITGLARISATGTLFAGTDWGVVQLVAGTSTWVATNGMPTVAVWGLTVSPDGKKVYAATHGRGAWVISTNWSYINAGRVVQK